MHAIYSDSFRRRSRARPRNQNFIGDEDEVRILQPRVEFHENDIEFHEVSYKPSRWPEQRPV